MYFFVTGRWYFHRIDEMVTFNRFPHRGTDLKKSILAILLFQFQSFGKSSGFCRRIFPFEKEV